MAVPKEKAPAAGAALVGAAAGVGFAKEKPPAAGAGWALGARVEAAGVGFAKEKPPAVGAGAGWALGAGVVEGTFPKEKGADCALAGACWDPAKEKAVGVAAGAGAGAACAVVGAFPKEKALRGFPKPPKAVAVDGGAPKLPKVGVAAGWPPGGGAVGAPNEKLKRRGREEKFKEQRRKKRKIRKERKACPFEEIP